MPISLGHMRNVPSEVTVHYNGETATVAYNKNAVSNKEWRQLRNRAKRAAADDAPPTDDLDDDFKIAVLCRLLVSWDVMDGKKPYPITREALDELPPEFLGAVIAAIVAQMFPQAETAPPTGSFS